MRRRRGWLYMLSLFLLIPCGLLTAQEIEDIKFEKTPRYTRRIYNPVILLKTITAGKTGDREKFDAIFNWVVQNVDYNYSTYYSSNGSYPIPVKKLLKRKRGVCINYAFLMDTLCKLADLKSAIITGYAKDELFDVNDSIYADNHAWNAVKLDGLWYLYDVTFASGEVYYRYSRFTMFINYLIEHAALKKKEIVIKPKIRFFFADDCDDGESEEGKKPIIKEVYMVRNKILLKVLLMFRPHYVRDYKKGLNAGYYLTRPDLFAIEHFPDNPDWSLLSERSLRDFEADSAFYHFKKDTLEGQRRYGMTCPDCDADLAYNRLNWNYNMRRKSLSFNSRNRFISSTCEYCIGIIKFQEAKAADDSLTKMTLIDTTKAYIKYGRESLKKGGLGARSNFMLQKDKNLRKEHMLLDENKAYYEFMKKLGNKSSTQLKKVSELQDKFQGYSKKIYRRGHRIRRMKRGSEIKGGKNRVEATIAMLKEKQRELKIKEDSLNIRLETLKTDFIALLPPLSDEVWSFVNRHDSLLLPLQVSAGYRKMLLDNYKKQVVIERLKAGAIAKRLGSALDSSIYAPSTESCRLADDLLKTLDRRNAVSEELYKMIEQLIGFSELPAKSLDDYRAAMEIRNQDDFCWLRGKNGIYLKSMFRSFNEMKKKQGAIVLQLRRENKLETVRAQTVVGELIRRKKKEMRIIIARRRVLFHFAGKVKKYRKKYLNKLSKERKKEKKRSKQNP